MATKIKNQTLRLALGGWFRTQRETSGDSLDDVSGKLDITRSALSQLETKGMGYKTALNHAKKIGWEVPTIPELLRDAGAGSSATLRLISLQPSAGTGMTTDNEEISQLDIPIAWIRRQYPDIHNIQNLALCTARGSSMEPVISNADTLLADTSCTSFDQEGIYVFTYQEELFVKLIQSAEQGAYAVVSANPLYPRKTLTPQDLEHVAVHARVVGKWVGFQPL